MAALGSYKSKQRTAIQEQLKQCTEEFLTVSELSDRFKGAGLEVGLTTIYRTLDLMEREGMVVKIPASNGESAQYRYVLGNEESPYGRLQCTNCGKPQYLECGHLDELLSHIEEEHHFQISRQHMLFYGICDSCKKRG